MLHFYDLSAWVGCWSSVSVRRISNSFLNVSFWIHIFCGYWAGWDPVNRFKHTSWMAEVTPTVRPKSVRNHCVIEVFGGVFMLYLNFFIFWWHSGFYHGIDSDLFLFVFKVQFSIYLNHKSSRVIRTRAIPAHYSSYVVQNSYTYRHKSSYLAFNSYILVQMSPFVERMSYIDRRDFV